MQASGPNEVWSWDISRLRGPHHRSWFYLYVVIDIFSRKIVAWTVDTAESTEVARTLVGTACDRNGISPQQLTLHSNRGAQMTSTSLAELLEDFAVTRSLSRPRVSNDNPYSEAGFKTVKYRHDYPDRFHSLDEVTLTGGSSQALLSRRSATIDSSTQPSISGNALGHTGRSPAATNRMGLADAGRHRDSWQGTRPAAIGD